MNNLDPLEKHQINIAWSLNEARMPEGKAEALAEKRFPGLAARMRRFLRWQDRQALLMGRMLLSDLLRRAGHGEDISGLCADEFARPFIEGLPDFNISHTDGWVACAIAPEGRIGLDIERWDPALKLDDFGRFFTDAEWALIYAARDPSQNFYRFWTAKEAVMKADGRGMQIPPREIELDLRGGIARLEGRTWHLKPWAPAGAVSGYVACSLPNFILSEYPYSP